MRQIVIFLFSLLTCFTSFSQGRTKIQTAEITDSLKLGNNWYKSLPITPVPTIAQAKALNVGIGTVINVGDSLQGGLFNVYQKTGYTIDNGLVFQMTSDTNKVLVRNRSLSTWINVEWYGAKHDGVTDDWQAITNAINSLPAYPSFNVGTFSGTVYFPGGTYHLTKPLILQRAVNLVGVSGFIQESTRLLFDNGIDGIIACAPIAADAQHSAIGSAQGFSIEHMTIVQDVGTKTIGHGIWMKVRGTLNDLSLSNWAGDGVHVEANAISTSSYNKVLLVDVAQPGSYSDTTAPTVTFVPTNGGSGAVAHAVLGGKVTGVQLLDTGAGYRAKPWVRIETTHVLERGSMHTNGWGAWANPTLQMDTVYITNGGSGYTHASVQFVGTAVIPAAGEITDSTILSDTTNLVDTTGGAGHVNVDIVNGKVTGVIITNRGEYNYMPQVVITGDGTGATGKAYASIKALYLNSILGGSWYEPQDTPVVYIFGGHEADDSTARDATAKVTTLGNWQLKRVEVDNGGDGYFTEPLITISGGHPITQGTLRAEIGRDRQGNANQFMIQKVRSVANSNGFVVRGGDVNAGNIVGCDFSYNAQMGIWDGAFLGNIYDGGHSTSNGVSPIYAISATGFNTYLNYYTEGNQPPIIALSPTVFIGGDAGARILEKPGVPAIKRDVGKISTGMNIETEGNGYFQTGGLFDNPGAGTILRYGGTSLASSYQLKQALTGFGIGDVSWLYGSDENLNGIMRITGAKTVQKFGRTAPVNNAVAIHKLMLGNSGSNYLNYRTVTMSNAFPPAKTPGDTSWGKGDFVFNTNPNAVTPILGWQRLTAGSSDSLGVDWRAYGAGISNQNAAPENGVFSITNLNNNGSFMTNVPTAVPFTPLTIPNSVLSVVNRFADPYWNLLNIYTNGNTSGGHISSPLSGSLIISAGAYYAQFAGGIQGGMHALETNASSYAQANGQHIFLNKTGMVKDSQYLFNKIAVLDSIGLNLTGATPDAGLTLKAGTTTRPPLKFTSGVTTTTPVAGAVGYDGTNWYFTPSSTRKRLPLQNDVTPTNGQLLIGNGTDWTVGSLNTGYGLTQTTGAGTISVVADTTSTTGLVSKDRLNNAISNINSSAAPTILLVPSANDTTTSGTEVNLTGLSTSLLANSKYQFTADLQMTTVGTGGVKFNLVVPTGTTFTLNAMGNTTSTANSLWSFYNGTGSAETVGTFATAAYGGGSAIATIHFSGVVQTGSNAGTIQLQFRANTAGELKTVLANSDMILIKGQ